MGQIIVWNIPEVAGEQLTKILQDKSAPSLVNNPNLIYSLKTAWSAMIPTPSGIFDHLVSVQFSYPIIKLIIKLIFRSRLIVMLK